MKIERHAIPGVMSIHPAMITDDRGTFHENWSHERYAAIGLWEDFVQDNVSRSARGVVRGLHFQSPHAQGKLISVLQGEIFDVAVDIRRGSPAFGQWMAIRLDHVTGTQFYVPPGCAHGFQALSDATVVHYKCTDYYRPDCERSLRWSDDALNIPWPLASLLSTKDADAPRLRDIDETSLPPFGP
ncbi:dTDP-4-dehydrorhamnose 3,5-epimerase [soil metagenome]